MNAHHQSCVALCLTECIWQCPYWSYDIQVIIRNICLATCSLLRKSPEQVTCLICQIPPLVKSSNCVLISSGIFQGERKQLNFYVILMHMLLLIRRKLKKKKPGHNWLNCQPIRNSVSLLFCEFLHLFFLLAFDSRQRYTSTLR